MPCQQNWETSQQLPPEIEYFPHPDRESLRTLKFNWPRHCQCQPGELTWGSSSSSWVRSLRGSCRWSWGGWWRHPRVSWDCWRSLQPPGWVCLCTPTTCWYSRPAAPGAELSEDQIRDESSAGEKWRIKLGSWWSWNLFSIQPVNFAQPNSKNNLKIKVALLTSTNTNPASPLSVLVSCLFIHPSMY